MLYAQSEALRFAVARLQEAVVTLLSAPGANSTSSRAYSGYKKWGAVPGRVQRVRRLSSHLGPQRQQTHAGKCHPPRPEAATAVPGSTTLCVGLIVDNPLPPVPPGGRCRCGSWLWYVRARNVDEHGKFECRRCGRQYRLQEKG